VRNAPQLVSDLRAVFPPVNQRYIFGPIVQLAWGTPTLLTLELAVVLDLPDPTRLLVLGHLQALLLQAHSVAKEVQRRLDRIADLERKFDAAHAGPESQRDHDLTRMKEIFGVDFRILPRLTPATAAHLTEAFGASGSLQANNPLAAVMWFQRASCVRERVARLHATMLYAETLGDGARLACRLGNCPTNWGIAG
jgi:hypothetical protein